MPALRAELAGCGFPGAQTYVQSGNVVLTSELPAAGVAGAIEVILAERFGFADVPVVVRTREELERIVALDPLRALAEEDKRYQVNFLVASPDPAALAALAAVDVAPEVWHADGREIYAWHPAGVHRSRLAPLLTDRRLKTTVTARNWRTVTTLLAMLRELPA